MITRLKRLKIFNLTLLIGLSIFFFNSYSKNETENNSLNILKESLAEQDKSLDIDLKSNKEKEEIADIYLNFENAKLSSVVNYLSEQKNINIIPKNELDSIEVTLTTREPLTLSKAWNILLTLLEINGWTIVKVENLYRIVPKANNKQEPLPLYSGIEPKNLPENDTVIRFIYFLKNIKANIATGFLASMLEGSVQTNEDLGALIITDRSISIKTAMKIIEELDQGGLREAIKVINLENANAHDIETLFKTIVPEDQQKNIRFLNPQAKMNKPSNYFSKDTKVIAMPRQNSLAIMGLEKNIDKVIDFIYKYLDVPIEAAESRLHIKELKYSKAEDLKTILTTIIAKPTELLKTQQVGKYKFFENVIIANDRSESSSDSTDKSGGGNRLIISCDKDDWRRLEKFIDALDKPQPQVAFEVMIADVTLESNFDFLSEFKPKTDSMLGKNINAQFQTGNNTDPTDYNVNLIGYSRPDGLAASETTNIYSGIAGTNITFGLPGSLWGTIKAVLNKDNTNIIIQPYMTVNNNNKCTITAQLSRRVNGDFSDKNLASSLIQKKADKTAKTEIILTPKTNLNGMINLDIEVTVDEFSDSAESNGSTTDRNLKTKLVVGTGEIIVLGGLTKSIITDDVYKVPLLSNIPIVGNLFKSKKKNMQKQNLYIFIRPSIIKPRFDAMPDEYTQMKLDYAKHSILTTDPYLKDKDPIQRWFFKPDKQSVHQKLSDAKYGVFRPLDQYAKSFNKPRSVDLKKDKYYRPDVKRAIKQKKKENKIEEIKSKPLAKRRFIKRPQIKSRTRV
jgi:general secretion pathway protein D